MINFRQLKANEIECRVGTTKCDDRNSDEKKNKYGCSLLLYKTARTDAKILDETVGAENWCVDHFQVKDKDFARVGIKIDGEWVYKSDCGSESNVEAEKGESSDALKRACFLWGLGRALYSSPFIWVTLTKDDFFNGRMKQSITFTLTEIAYDVNGDICKLRIVRNDNGEEVFSKTSGVPVEEFDSNRAFQSIKDVFKDKVIIQQAFLKNGVKKFSELNEEKMKYIVSELVASGIGIVDNKK